MVKRIVALSLVMLVSFPACLKKQRPVEPVQTVVPAVTADSYKKVGGTAKFDEDAEEFYLLEEESEGNVFEEGMQPVKGDGLQLEEVIVSPEGAEAIQFDFDSAQVKPSQKTKIKHNTAIAKEALQEHPESCIVCDGHSCKITRSKIHNQVVSQQRAEEVKKEYVAQNIPAEKIKAIGHGDAERLTNRDGMEAQSINRRVETKVVVQ